MNPKFEYLIFFPSRFRLIVQCFLCSLYPSRWRRLAAIGCLSCLISTVSFGAGVTNQEIDAAILGEAGGTLARLLEDMKTGWKEGAWEQLGSEYQREVPSDEMQEVLKRHEWHLEKCLVVSVTSFDECEIAVVDFMSRSVESGRVRRLGSIAPVIMKREAGRWRVWNFPFAANLLPDFPNAVICLRPSRE